METGANTAAASFFTGCAEMNAMTRRAYMKGAEFKARQGWLPFVDAVGIVLQVLEPVKAAAWNWFKQWKKSFRTKAPAVAGNSFQQLELFFWAGRETPSLF